MRCVECFCLVFLLKWRVWRRQLLAALPPSALLAATSWCQRKNKKHLLEQDATSCKNTHIHTQNRSWLLLEKATAITKMEFLVWANVNFVYEATVGWGNGIFVCHDYRRKLLLFKCDRTWLFLWQMFRLNIKYSASALYICCTEHDFSIIYVTHEN